MKNIFGFIFLSCFISASISEAANVLPPFNGGSSGGGVTSVTGLNTDNTNPATPVVKVSVDGVTITGLGTPGSPLMAVTGGTGTVTSVAGTNANGISFTISNPTTTPNITLSLGAITPSSVAASGVVSGSNLSGTNTGDQTITLTGDVTGSGAGSFAATIGANKVSYAKMQQASTVTLLGNPTGGTANVSEITLGSGLSFSGSTLVASASAPAYTSITGVPTVSLLGNPTGGTANASAITLGAGLSFSGTTLTASGSAPAFSAITGGTNTPAAMFVGTGGSLTVSGSGTINATTLNAATFAAPGAIGGTTPGTGAFTTVTNTGETITSSSAAAFSVGANGATTPALNIDASTASSVTGLNIKSAISGSGITLTALGGANEPVNISTKGTGSASVINLQVGGTTRYSMASGTQHLFTTSVSPTAANPRFSFVGANDVTLTASTEATSVFFNISQTRQHATGAIATQRDFRVQGAQHSAVGASTITDYAVSTIDWGQPAGTNITMTSATGLEIYGTNFTGSVNNGYGLKVTAPTNGSVSDFSAQFNGPIDLEGSVPTITSCGSGAPATGSNTHKGQVTGITAATACTITFAAAQPLPSPPTCTFSSNAGLVPTITSISTTAVTTTMAALTGTLYYQCF